MPQRPAGGWTAGRVIALVVGAVLGLNALGGLIAGAAVLAVDRGQRDSAGFLTSPGAQLSTQTGALVSDRLGLDVGGPDWAYPRAVLGDSRLRVTAADAGDTVFAGIAPADAVAEYLAGTQYATVTDFVGTDARYVTHDGTAVPAAPASSDIWVEKVSGSGTQTLSWTPSDGDWAIVVMNADASPGVSVRADVGATAPFLVWIAVGLLVGSGAMLALGIALVAVPVHRASSASPTGVR